MDNKTSNPAQEKEQLFLQKKREIKAKLQGQVKRLKKSITTCEKSLQECLKWEIKQHEATLLQANFAKLKRGMSEITVSDWLQNESEITLSLNPKIMPKDEIAARFKRARKLKIGIPHQQKELLKLEGLLENTLKEIEEVESITTLEDFLAAFPEPKKKNKSKPEKPLPYRTYTSKTGLSILVGKSSTANDALTFQHAKGSDLWLHVKDYPGSHVVIVRPKGAEVDHETIEMAAQLACFYSKAKDEPYAEVCLTEKKYVSRFGKLRNGKVQISKQKVMSIKVDKTVRTTMS